jgi:hypothetical protein
VALFVDKEIAEAPVFDVIMLKSFGDGPIVFGEEWRFSFRSRTHKFVEREIKKSSSEFSQEFAFMKRPFKTLFAIFVNRLK